MYFDPDKYWSTHLEALEATNESTWFGSILNYLDHQVPRGILLISSADSFHSVNDQLGRDVGDAILLAIWDSLSHEDSVTFGARLSGDGLIFAFEVSVGDLPEFASKHLKSFEVSDSLLIYRSMGCALIPTQWAAQREQWNLLLQSTQMAHDHAKKRGGNMAIRCTSPLGLTHGTADDFYRKAENFQVLFAGEPSRHVYEQRDEMACG